MGNTAINVGAIIGLSGQAQRAKNTISNVKSSITTVRNQVDDRITSRNNIYGRFNSISSQLSVIESRIGQIMTTVEKGANQYFATDQKVHAWSEGVIGKVSAFGTIGQGFGAHNPLLPKSQGGAKVCVEKKGTQDSTFVKILKDDWKLEGAKISGSATATGSVLGFHSSGTAEGELIGGSIKTKSKAKWIIEKGDTEKGNTEKGNTEEGYVGLEKSIEAEGHVAKGKLEGNIGYVGGSVSGTFISGTATGKIGATLYKDKKFAPALEAKLKAEAAFAKGEANVKAGSDEFNAHGKASGTLFGAEAEASGSAGIITYKDETKGFTKTEVGVKGKVGAEAYVAQGKISGGFTVLGIKIDAGVQGKLGGAGVSAEGRVTTGGVSGKLGLGLGVGAGLEISVDWSGFSLW